MTAIPPTPPSQTPAAARPEQLAQLREAATELEASFLAEMLKSAGLGASEGEFSGGTGEAQFDSFLRMEQAREIARSGGIGLAEQIFESLKGRIDD